MAIVTVHDLAMEFGEQKLFDGMNFEIQDGDRIGLIVIEKEDNDEDKLMEDALEAGAEDFSTEETDVYEIYTAPEDFGTLMEALEAKGYEFVSADVSMIPSTYTKIDDTDAAEKMQKLLDMLDDNDDVQNVYHNWDMPEEPDDE